MIRPNSNNNQSSKDCQLTSSLTSLDTTGNIFTSRTPKQGVLVFDPPTPIPASPVFNNVDEYKRKLYFCENEFRMYRCAKCDVFHARPRWCKDRFCPRCSKYLSRRARRALRGLILERKLGTRGNRHSLKFVTLTCENFPVDRLKWGLDHMNKWFSRLIRRAFWKGKVKGGLKRIEVTKDKDDKYHLHIHALIEGGFIPQDVLAGAWREIISKDNWTGFIVDIRAVKGLKKATFEISKYCFKPNSLSLEDKAFLSKLFLHRRLYSFFGEWFDNMRGVDLNDPDDGLVCVCGSTDFRYEGIIFRSSLIVKHGWVGYSGGFISRHPFDST